MKTEGIRKYCIMTRGSEFLRFLLSMVIFLTSCVSSNLVAFHHPVCSLPQRRECTRVHCYAAIQRRANWLYGWKHRAVGTLKSSRTQSWANHAMYRMCASKHHPDDDPSSGSVLPVKDRIALYSQARGCTCLRLNGLLHIEMYL